MSEPMTEEQIRKWEETAKWHQENAVDVPAVRWCEALRQIRRLHKKNERARELLVETYDFLDVSPGDEGFLAPKLAKKIRAFLDGDNP